MLTDAVIGPEPPTPIDLVLLHPEIGVALLEVAPHWSHDAPAQLRHRLDQARFGAIFPGQLPVVHRMLRPAELAALPRLLAEAFADQPPLALPGGDAWVHAVRRALLARPAAAADPPLPPPHRHGGVWRARLTAGLTAAATAGILAVVLLPGVPPGRPDGETTRTQPEPPIVVTEAPDLRASAPVKAPIGTAETEPEPSTIAPQAPAPVTPAPPTWSTSTATAALGEVRTVAFAGGGDPTAKATQLAVPNPIPPAGSVPPSPPPPPEAATMPPYAVAAFEAGSGAAPAIPAVPMPGTPPPDPPLPPAPSLALSLAPTPAIMPAPPAGLAAAPATAPQPALSVAPAAPSPVPDLAPNLVPGLAPDLPLGLALAIPAIVLPPPLPTAHPAPNSAMLQALLRRGEALLALGDVSGARRFFERAADAGSAAGALAAGHTYDPDVLTPLGAWGIRPDPVAASAWYHRARELEQQARDHSESTR